MNTHDFWDGRGHPYARDGESPHASHRQQLPTPGPKWNWVAPVVLAGTVFQFTLVGTFAALAGLDCGWPILYSFGFSLLCVPGLIFWKTQANKMGHCESIE